MKKIIIDNGDGTVGILIPAPEALKTMSIQDIADKDIPNGLSYEIVDISMVPTERAFRNAWKAKVGGLETDIPRAKLIAHDMRRRYRDELFKPLDIEATIPSKAQTAEQARQAIRDADTARQLRIDNCSTENELLAEISTIR